MDMPRSLKVNSFSCKGHGRYVSGLSGVHVGFSGVHVGFIGGRRGYCMGSRYCSISEIITFNQRIIYNYSQVWCIKLKMDTI